MPLKVENSDIGTVRRLVIACDSCGLENDDQQIAAAGGLIEMGWLRRFNSETRQQEYFCPQHHPKEQASGN